MNKQDKYSAMQLNAMADMLPNSTAAKMLRQCAIRLQSLEAENARYRAALELIALDDGFEDEAEDLQSIARNALKED